MIPVVTIDNKGEVIGHQAFNDNLTPVEQLNRETLAILVGAQQKLTNLKYKVDTYVMFGNRTAEDITQLKTAAEELGKAVATAIATFEAAADEVIAPAEDGE